VYWAALRVSIASPTRNSIKIQLRKRVPAGTYPVYVVNSAGKSNTVNLTITSSGDSPCKDLYWHDSVNTACEQKQFCGVYMYQTLSTFRTQSACRADLKNYHQADLDRNRQISEAERQNYIGFYQSGAVDITHLLRVIQFSNSASYRVDPTNTEDGFAPVPK
ncbi:MAG: hypothetical protein WC537_01385, partial [Candidatus Paceibacterota bacterium]